MTGAAVLAPITLVIGEEGLLIDRAVTAVIRATRAVDPDADVDDVDASTLGPGDLAGLLTPSLFGQRRAVVLRGAQDLGKEVAAEVTAYAGDPLSEVCLVLVHAGGQKGKALLAALAGSARRVEAQKITKAGERRDMVREELRAGGRPVHEQAVTLLVDAVGTDLRELCSAASQLLADTEGPITEEVVARYHRGRAEGSGFAVAECAVEGDLAGALELTRWGQSTGLAHVLVTSALASTLRSVALVASSGRTPVGTLAGQLGMPPWRIEKARRQARGWHPAGLSCALQAVAVADADVKGAAADPAYAVERTLVAVVAARSVVR